MPACFEQSGFPRMSDMAVSTTLILFMGFAIVLVVLFGKVAADSHFFARTSTGTMSQKLPFSISLVIVL